MAKQARSAPIVLPLLTLARPLPEHRPANLLAEEEVFSHFGTARAAAGAGTEGSTPRPAHKSHSVADGQRKGRGLLGCAVFDSANGESILPAGD